MTHLNIGATLAMAAWVLTTGQQIVAGERQVGPRPVLTRPHPSAHMPAHTPAPNHPPAADAARMELVAPAPVGLRT